MADDITHDQKLLDRNENGQLTLDERLVLRDLRQAADRFLLRKA